MSLEPQSIVHQVVRMERTLVKAVSEGAFVKSMSGSKLATSISASKLARAMKMRRKRKSGDNVAGLANAAFTIGETTTESQQPKQNEKNQFPIPKMIGGDDFFGLNLEELAPKSKNRNGAISSPNLTMPSSTRPPISHTGNALFTIHSSRQPSKNNNSTRVALGMTDGKYETYNQNDFMINRLMNAQGCSFVHFFKEDSRVSDAIDKQLEQLAKTIRKIKFLRVEAQLAPFIRQKLNLKTDSPTVVLMRYGSAVNRISDFDTDDCSELQDWVPVMAAVCRFQS